MLKHALTITLWTISLGLYAQKLTPDWMRAMGKGTDVYTKDVVTDAAGNAYLVGYFSGTGIDFALGGTNTTIVDSEGDTDAFLAKYTSAGELDWVHTFGTTATERFNAIAMSQTGDLLLVGYLSSNATGFDIDPGASTVTVTSSNDALVAKFDTDGNYLDHFVIGGENTAIQEFHDIAVNQGDTIYVGGYSDYPGADMDPDTDVSQLYTNSASPDGILGVYASDFDFLYGRRTQSNKGSEFYKLGIDAHGDAYAMIRWGFESSNFDGSITFENTPTYAAAFGSYVFIGKEEFISGQGYRRGYGMNVVKLSKSGTASWYRSFIGGASAGANLVNDFIGVGDYIYLAGQLNSTYFYQSSSKNMGTAGTHGYVFRLGTDGSGFVDKYFKTTTTTADYVHSIDTVGSNLVISGYWNGSGTMDLDPGTDTYNIEHSNYGTYWAALDTDLSFQQGGFLASSGGSIGMTKPNLISLGSDQFLFTGYQDNAAEYIESNYGPNVVSKGTAISKMSLTPNQAPEIVTTVSDTLIGSNNFGLTNVEALFSDPEDKELTISLSVPFSEDYSAYLTDEHPAYSLNISFAAWTTVEVTLTATDPLGASVDMTFHVGFVKPQGIANSYPVNGQYFVPLDTTIGFSYSTALETSNLEENLQVSSNFRGLLAGNWTISADSVYFNPDSEFFPGETITVNVLKGIKASDPTQLAIPQAITFTTATTEPVNDLSVNSSALGFNGQDVTDAIFADIDADGDLDVIASSHFNTDLIYLLNDGKGEFEDAVKIGNTYGLSHLKAVDMNADGHLDIVANSGNAGLFIYYHDGALNFNEVKVIDGSSDVQDVDVADFNADGLPDIVRADKTNKTIQLLTQNRDSTFTASTFTPATINDMRDVIFGDFTGDGLVDIAMSDSYAGTAGVYIYKQYAGGTFSYLAKPLNNYAISKLYPVDIDQDGDLDIAYSRYQAYGGGVLLNNGTGSTFTNKAISDNSNFDTNSIISGDIDSDGDIDLLLTSVYTKKVFAYLNDGATSFTTQVLHTATYEPRTISLGDVDGDLDLDMVVTTANLGTTTLLENLVIKLLPPTLVESLEEITIDEDQSSLLVTDQLDTLFTNQVSGDLSFEVSTANDSLLASIENGSLLVTATDHFNGTTSLYLSATNSIGTTTDTVSVVVNAVDDAPIVSNPFADQEGDEDALRVIIDMATAFVEFDGESLTYDFSIIEGFDWITSERIDDELGITSVADSFGIVQVVISATDPNDNSVSDTLSITINPVNDVPAFELDRSQVIVGMNFASTEQIIVTDLSPANEDDQTITYSISPAISFANVSIDAFSGTVSITSVTDSFGGETFTITADDGQSSNNTATQQFTLTILDNEPPVVEVIVEDQTFEEDATTRQLVADVSTLFSDPEGASLTFDATSDNANISLEIASNRLTYGTAADYHGSATITITANDGNSTTSLDFTLTITPVNDAPIVNNAVPDLTATEDMPFSFLIPADQFTDVDLDNLNLTVEGVPSWLTFDGLSLFLHGTPSNEDVGTVTITMTADDGLLSVTDEFTMTVVNVNDAPVFTQSIGNMTILEDAGQVVLMDLDTLVEDVDSENLTFYLGSDLDVFSLAINEENQVLVTAPDHVFGSDNLYIGVEDEEFFIETSFTLTVTSVNDAPEFSLDTQNLDFLVNETQVQTITITPMTPVFGEESESITYTIIQGTNQLVSASVTSLELSITPLGTTGTETITIQANDGQSENNLFEVQVTIVISEVLGEQPMSLEVYPNPTTALLMIPTNEDGEYQIWNTSGQLIQQGTIQNGQINVETLLNGTYLLRLIGDEGGGSVISRFIKN